MAFQSTTFLVLIGSPSDLERERKAVRDAIYEWNELHAEAEQTVLLPVMWETHSTPKHGEPAQSVINRDLVDKCDLLIGMFWSKLGTPTGAAESGTVEEIDRMAENGKEVMLYFSERRVALNKIDTDQLDRLREFKQETYAKGLCGKFASPAEANRVVLRDLTRRVRTMKVAHSQKTTITVTEQVAAEPDDDDENAEWFDEFEKRRKQNELRLIRGEYYKIKGNRFFWTVSVEPREPRRKPLTFREEPLRMAGGGLRPIGWDNAGVYIPTMRTLAMSTAQHDTD
jgi:hypothetical protein